MTIYEMMDARRHKGKFKAPLTPFGWMILALVLMLGGALFNMLRCEVRWHATATTSPEVIFTAPAPVPEPPHGVGHVAAAEFAYHESDWLAEAIRIAPSTGRLGADEAEWLAGAIEAAAEPEVDAWLLAAIAWRESGFRAWAVEGDRGVRGAGGGPGEGLFQHHVTYAESCCSFNPSCAAVAEVEKDKRWIAYHAKTCAAAHLPVDEFAEEFDWLPHRFAGTRVTSSAIESAREVLRRRVLLWESVHIVD